MGGPRVANETEEGLARGMSVRDIQSQLSELYGTDVSPDLISSVTDEVMLEVQAWQARRRILYTTNAIESLNYQLRKIIKSKGHFPSDDDSWAAGVASTGAVEKASTLTRSVSTAVMKQSPRVDSVTTADQKQ